MNKLGIKTNVEATIAPLNQGTLGMGWGPFLSFLWLLSLGEKENNNT
jgi:hypothetical protein